MNENYILGVDEQYSVSPSSTNCAEFFLQLKVEELSRRNMLRGITGARTHTLASKQKLANEIGNHMRNVANLCCLVCWMSYHLGAAAVGVPWSA